MESVRAKPFKLTVSSRQGSAWAFRKTIQNFPNGPVNGSLQILCSRVRDRLSLRLRGPYLFFLFILLKKKKSPGLSVSLQTLFLVVWDTFDRERPLIGLWHETIVCSSPYVQDQKSWLAQIDDLNLGKGPQTPSASCQLVLNLYYRTSLFQVSVSLFVK